jgi:xanthine dehydrogenase accessory factor
VSEAALRDAAARWLREGRSAMLVEVLSARGSVPREAGTRMLVAADAVLGTIGGGHLELQAIEAARALLAEAGKADGPAAPGEQPRHKAAIAPLPPVDQAIALGPTLGQCCGGALVLRTRPFDAAALAAWPEPRPRFTLQLYGAGHVGRAIVDLLAGIDCRVNWIDEREGEFPPDPLPGHIGRVCVEPVEAEVAAAPPGAFHLVLTHSHDLDLAICRAILERDRDRGDIGFFGLIGSATKRARFEHRLLARGFTAAQLARMHCPIGVPGIPGKEPEVIAVAVVAQLLQQAAAPTAA